MSAVVHVLIPFVLCIALANTDLFNEVLVDVTYDHYAEKKVDNLPVFLAMPFNCLINVGYILLGIYWLLQPVTDCKDSRAVAYAKNVFALMAIAYGPVQWVRLSTLRRAPSVLDQWFTLPIFAWVPVWCNVIVNGWSSRYTVIVEMCSILSYGLAVLHDRGFEVALGYHIAFALFKGVQAQKSHGDAVSKRYFCVAALSCFGFVVSEASGSFSCGVLDVSKCHWTFLVQSFATFFSSIMFFVPHAPQ